MSTEPPSTEDPSQASSRCEIVLLNPCHYRQVAARRLRPWLATVVESLAPQADSLAVRFVSDREMRRLNHTYRQRDRVTDVLSFPGDLRVDSSITGVIAEMVGQIPTCAVPRDAPCHLGDIVIALPAARRQASARGHAVERELRLLLLHGVLHCLGYDHESDNGSMERLERRLRARLIDV